MFDFLKKKKKAKETRFSYDAVNGARENREHWHGADHLTPDQLNNAVTRKILRSNARYEYDNNPWLNGLVNQIAEDVVGTGARLQILNNDERLTAEIEREFAEWAEEVKLTEILQNLKKSASRDGEAFILLSNRPANQSACKLFPMLFLPERVCSPIDQIGDAYHVDGVNIDQFGLPISYDIAEENPDNSVVMKWQNVKAKYVIHFFTVNYAEQHRGVPEYTPCLNDIALLRRYTKATLDKMENASNISGVLTPKDSLEAQIEDLEPVKSFEKFKLPARSFVALPLGYELKQYELGNPNDSQQQFALNVKIDCARCMLATRNVVTGDSSNYNYASGRLDFQSYFRAIQSLRHKIETQVLDKIFSLWIKEFKNNESFRMPSHSWFWDGFSHVDPVKESKSETIDMENGSRTLVDVCAEHGKDWKTQVNNRLMVEKYEREQREKLGLPMPEIQQISVDGGDEE